MSRPLDWTTRPGGRLFSLQTPSISAMSLPVINLTCPETDMRILVVEDDAKIASFVVNGLKQSGFAVDRCADGEEGLHQAQMAPYDAIVADIMLPKLDGLRLVQQ